MANYVTINERKTIVISIVVSVIISQLSIFLWYKTFYQSILSNFPDNILEVLFAIGSYIILLVLISAGLVDLLIKIFRMR